jgi:hypothetical protein
MYQKTSKPDWYMNTEQAVRQNFYRGTSYKQLKDQNSDPGKRTSVNFRNVWRVPPRFIHLHDAVLTEYPHSPLTFLKFRSWRVLGTVTDFRYITIFTLCTVRERTFQSNDPQFRKSTAFWKIPRLRPFFLLIRATCRWRGVRMEHW